MSSLLRMRSWPLFMFSFGIPLILFVCIFVILLINYWLGAPFTIHVDYAPESLYTKELETMQEIAPLFILFLIPAALTIFFTRWKKSIVTYTWKVHFKGELKFPNKLFQVSIWFPFVALILAVAFSPIYASWIIETEYQYMIYAMDFYERPMHYTMERTLIASGVIAFFGVVSSILELWTSLETARAIRSVEQNRKVSAGEVVSDWFLVVFYPIGIFALQPRVNEFGLNDSVDREIEYMAD
ncbi:MAG: hypothetical protein HWD92_06280 [Flavobacteriia bacterium]|nr:hypothetical protein [Flavobacteriia bacterium]